MAEDRQQRRLATILAADVFGYSRLTAENEEDALRTLKAHRGVIDRLIRATRAASSTPRATACSPNSARRWRRCAVRSRSKRSCASATLRSTRTAAWTFASASMLATCSSMATIFTATGSTSRRGSKASPHRAVFASLAACSRCQKQALLWLRGHRPANSEEHPRAGAYLSPDSRIERAA